MMTIEVIQLASYITSVLVCAVLAVSFLQKFLNKRLRVSLWWGTGFSLLACGILTMTVGAVYGFHKILGMVAFAFVAASMTFLYYVTSLHFFGRTSFFREKFTVILFVVSLVLFVLPLYRFDEGYVAEIVRSPTIVLFAVAFLVVAVLYSVLFNQVAQVAVTPPEEYFCSRIGALQSSVWIVTAWGLYLALFWGSVITVGLVFVLSVCGFMLLWYGCRGGENMTKEKENEEKATEEENRELSIQRIDSVEYKIKLKADSIQEKLNNAMQEIGVVLLRQMTAKVENPGIYQSKGKRENARYLLQENVRSRAEAEILTFEEEKRKNKMLTRASTIGMKEDELVVRVVKLAENILALARSAYEDLNPYQFDGASPPRIDSNGDFDMVPLDLDCAEAGSDFEGTEEATSAKIKKLATLAFFKSSTDRDVIRVCCELVKAACKLENSAVTKMKWKELPKKEHPGGMIGHTYNILCVYGEKTEIEEYAEDFKERFQGEADERLEEAEALEKNADDLIRELPATKKQVDPEEQAERAVDYLGEAIGLLQNASLLVRDASDFVENRLNPGL